MRFNQRSWRSIIWETSHAINHPWFVAIIWETCGKTECFKWFARNSCQISFEDFFLNIAVEIGKEGMFFLLPGIWDRSAATQTPWNEQFALETQKQRQFPWASASRSIGSTWKLRISNSLKGLTNLAGGFKCCLFSSLLGEDSHFD